MRNNRDTIAFVFRILLVIVSAWAIVDTFEKNPDRWISLLDFMLSGSIVGKEMRTVGTILVFLGTTIVLAFRVRSIRVRPLVIDAVAFIIILFFLQRSMDGYLLGL